MIQGKSILTWGQQYKYGVSCIKLRSNRMYNSQKSIKNVIYKVILYCPGQLYQLWGLRLIQWPRTCIFTSEGFVVSTFRQTLRLTTLKIYY